MERPRTRDQWHRASKHHKLRSDSVLAELGVQFPLRKGWIETMLANLTDELWWKVLSNRVKRPKVRQWKVRSKLNRLHRRANPVQAARRPIVCQPIVRQPNAGFSIAAYLDLMKSRAWKIMRYETLAKQGRVCALCRTTTGPFHVDHIVPTSKAWHLRLDPTNLQVLCADCNIGKGSEIGDFRTPLDADPCNPPTRQP